MGRKNAFGVPDAIGRRFVTAKAEPNDVDAVVWLNDDYLLRVARADEEAVELEMMLATLQPAQIVAAEDNQHWVTLERACKMTFRPFAITPLLESSAVTSI